MTEQTKAIPILRQGPKKRIRQPITITLATSEKIKAYRERATAEGLSLGGWLELAADARLEMASEDGGTAEDMHDRAAPSSPP